MSERRVGIDVGGSSIKAALVDVDEGIVIGSTESVPTPNPSAVEPMLDAFVELDRRLQGAGAVGLAMPSVVQNGIVRTAANIDKSWIGVNGAGLLGARLKRPVMLLNDADAAGHAEVRLGAGRGISGTIIVLTFGTGIGSAIFVDGILVPNTEFGHLELNGGDAEWFASARVRTEEKLDWPQWAERVNVYLARMHALFWPEMFILGGAISENFAAFGPLLQSPAEIRPAQFAGQAGVIGSALAAARRGR
jgi:polyphosphate glucokinase